MKKKASFSNSISNALLTVTVCFIFVLVSEFFMRVLPLSDKLGCVRAPSFSKRVQSFNRNAKIKIVSLGDSFVEWRLGEGVNMFDYVQKNLFEKGVAVLNLGKGGSDIEYSIAVYKKYVVFKPQYVVMCLYFGNDLKEYSPYFAIDTITVSDYAVLPEEKVKFFLKRHSVLLNLISRFLKQKIPFTRSRFFERNIAILQKENDIPESYVQKRISRIDPKVLELVKSDSINAWDVAMGIVMPEYYKKICFMSSGDCLKWADSTIALIDAFKKEQGLENFLVVLLPVSFQVSSDYDSYFKKCGFDLENFPLQERRKGIEYIEMRLKEIGVKTLNTIPGLEKEKGVYLDFDIHLNKKGQKVVGEMVTEFIKDNYLPAH